MKESEKINQNPKSTYTTGETSDSDKSYEWKVKHRMGLKKPETPPNASVLPKMLKTRMDEELPENVDWSPWCSPIKDQSKFFLHNFIKFS